MRLLSIVALLAAGILAGTQLGKIAPLVGWYQQEIGFSLVLTGWFTAMIGIFVALAALPAGWAIERVGTRRSFVIASLVLMVGGVALAFLRSPAAILAARLMEGLGYLVLVITIPALLNSIPAPKWRAPALAVWGGFVPLGYAVGDYLARAADAPSAPGRYLLAAILLFGLFAALATLLLARVPDGSEAPANGTGAFGGFAATMTLPVVIVALAFGLYVILSIGFFTFLPAFVERSASSIALAAGAISLTVPLGNLLAGLLVRGGARNALLLAALGFAATALAAWPTFAVSIQATATMSMVLFAVAGGVIASALFAAIPAVVPPGGSTAVAIGLVCQAGGIGTVIGPPLAAQVIDAYSWTGFALFMVAV
ncbi:MFS transporter [Pseudaminobacter sp. 19-2017]|uniref:MFS transporter n=1 Tax=Pseudaminobacter soli (ex Zhang et al. 2022) TaxID=2831468 RepID=A0A942DXU6_9HYPH|nr:MFS transporter [Pseudaminobacter soli]MBS3650184.1 MFS transporter [Pseudaminobacter soli]